MNVEHRTSNVQISELARLRRRINCNCLGYRYFLRSLRRVRDLNRSYFRIFGKFFLCLLLITFFPGHVNASINTSTTNHDRLQHHVSFFAGLDDRSTGTSGNRQAAEYIKEVFEKSGPETLSSMFFTVPVLRHEESFLRVGEKKIPLRPLHYNAIQPQNIGPQGLSGRLIYTGNGDLRDFNGMDVKGAIVLMELDSGRNWLNAASLGASALIYINRGVSDKTLFLKKQELSPLQFPCFWISEKTAALIPGNRSSPGRIADISQLHSNIRWQEENAKNIYCLFKGTDPQLSNDLIIVEAFFDSSLQVAGLSPGADEALSISALLELANHFHRQPPKRSFLLVATNGHGQSLAGMREMIWSINARSRDFRKLGKQYKSTIKERKNYLRVLRQYSAGPKKLTPEDQDVFHNAITSLIKQEVDSLSSRLMLLRMHENGEVDKERIKELANRRLRLRQLGWRTSFIDLQPDDQALLHTLVAPSIAKHQEILADAEFRKKYLKSEKRFRSLVIDYTIATVVSLHLSSRGSGLGAFERGFLHQFRPRINRTAAYLDIHHTLVSTAEKNPEISFISALRPDRLRPWQDLLPDHPWLGSEVSALAGLPGFTLTTINDRRPYWSTPFDTPDHINWDFASNQYQLVHKLILGLDSSLVINNGRPIRNGFSTISGRTNLLLHGELFANHPAPGAVILAFQGPARYHVMTDKLGNFLLKGMADKKHVFDKVILEGYRFSEKNGSAIWAIDKKQTGKPRYRIKMRRTSMKTDLVMFGCRQTTIFDLLEPRTMRYMTKLKLIDGRREAPPTRYWYSRIDTRSSIIASIFLQPETRLKLTLSDNVLQKKMILTNSSEHHPRGEGFQVEKYPTLPHTGFLAAIDMWNLLGPRIDNLEQHGIHNERIRRLTDTGKQEIEAAKSSLKEFRYDAFTEQTARSWALASRVYQQVEKTQKDVLFGVLFYIALFVPFAFCAERLLFGYVSIYKRILSFSGILLLLITIIYNVHPAFQLAYSPTVVILAFFIIGLSFLVSLIIFFRFEDEMVLLQRRASHKRPAEISNWKALAAAFFLGITNLRRRRMRTALTCLTLIILTFTIMSFTTVKSMRHQARLLFQETAPYQGLLLKKIGWNNLPVESLQTFSSLFSGRGIIAPRFWLEADQLTRTPQIELRRHGKSYTMQGITGFSKKEAEISRLDRILIGGRWLTEDDRRATLIPEKLAIRMNIDPRNPAGAKLLLHGMEMEVVGVFSGKRLQEYRDLDGETLTPITYPSETMLEVSEVEKEALESGEDVRGFQSRYRHTPPERIIIMPWQTLENLGGHLKSVAILPDKGTDRRQLAEMLSDRLGLAIFSGEPDGVYLYNASDTISYSGVPNIVIPLAISVLIVLNTMISSVYERKREIAVYTSVGLAPSHVSFLFVAEATAFAVLSVVLGYLVAQISAKLLAGTSLWAGITVNYSSMAGVAAMVLVIGVVLISVIYPSRVASNIAIPDVNRSWSLPESDGNTITVTLPFLMRYREHRSIGGFLLSYLQGHQDVSHGPFSTGEVELVTLPTDNDPNKLRIILKEEKECMHLRSKVWLAPFDFGIMQNIDIKICPATEGEDFLEIQATMTRLSGEATLWRRMNKPFLHALRKQLLVWRSLDKEGHRQFSKILKDEYSSLSHA